MLLAGRKPSPERSTPAIVTGISQAVEAFGFTGFTLVSFCPQQGATGDGCLGKEQVPELFPQLGELEIKPAHSIAFSRWSSGSVAKLVAESLIA